MASARDPSLPRLLVVSGYPPNARMGGGIILRNLLQQYPADRLTILSNARVIEQLAADPNGGLLDALHVPVSPWRSNIRGVRRVLRTVNVLQTFRAARASLRRLSAGDVILAVPWGGEIGSELFAAAYFMHRRSGAGLVVYEMDEWRASLGPAAGLPARVLEGLFHARLVRAAKSVWVISPPLVDQFRQRFGVEAQIMAHCVDIERFHGARSSKQPEGGPRRILYAGAIYGPQVDAIRNVLHAIQNEPSLPYTLVLYTGQSANELAEFGIAGPALRVEPLVPVEQIPELLASADVLLLPFAFEPGQREVVSTSFPTKTADYLASGVPVLVHAPPYATVSRLARAEGWAEVVDEPCIDLLRTALQKLMNDNERRQSLKSEALRVARQRHDLTARRAAFLDSIRAAAGRSRQENGQDTFACSQRTA